MKITWKTNKKFKPEFVFIKLNKSMKITDEQVSFSSFDKTENEVTIANMLDFGSNIAAYEKTRLVSRAIFECAKKGLSKDNFLVEINNLRSNSTSSNKEQMFHLLTTISLPFLPALKKTSIGNCEIFFYPNDKGFPKKYRIHRDDRINESSSTGLFDEKTYVIVKVKNRFPANAADECLSALNAFRALICIKLNSGLELYFGGPQKAKSINKVTLGRFHTLHNISGEIATDVIWYEDKYLENNKVTLAQKDIESLENFLSWSVKKLNKITFSNDVIKCLVRFADAFDEPDCHSCLIKAWSALEAMVSTHALREGNDNDLISRRCSFLFDDREFHIQVIEHIREYRNRNVHYGESTDNPTIICYQLQRYLIHLILFYLNFGQKFTNKNEANNFLDLPSNLDELKIKRTLITKGIRYRTSLKM